MNKNFLLLSLISILFFSCGSQKAIRCNEISGSYYTNVEKSGFTTLYTLVLNEDSTFIFSIKTQDGNPKCHGNWEITDNQFLILKCEEADMFEALTNGYMSQREHIIQIINKNKLKYKDIVLKRQNK